MTGIKAVQTPEPTCGAKNQGDKPVFAPGRRQDLSTNLLLNYLNGYPAGGGSIFMLYGRPTAGTDRGIVVNLSGAITAAH